MERPWSGQYAGLFSWLIHSVRAGTIYHSRFGLYRYEATDAQLDEEHVDWRAGHDTLLGVCSGLVGKERP